MNLTHCNHGYQQWQPSHSAVALYSKRRGAREDERLTRTYPQISRRCEVPFDISAQSGHIDTSRDIDTFGQSADVWQRPLDTIKNSSHNARSQFHREGFASTQYRISYRDTSWRLAEEKFIQTKDREEGITLASSHSCHLSNLNTIFLLIWYVSSFEKHVA